MTGFTVLRHMMLLTNSSIIIYRLAGTAAAFNFSSPEHIDFKKCWSLENLQPMWGKENAAKRDKLSKPFQPSLRLSYGPS